MSIPTEIKTYRVVATLQNRYINCQGASSQEEVVSILEEHSQEIKFVTARKPSRGIVEQELSKMGFDLYNDILVHWYEVSAISSPFDEF